MTHAMTKDRDSGTQKDPCFRLIYRSRSLLPNKPEDGDTGLAEILRISRTNNRSRGVTGALVLYEHKQRFAQVLEGTEKEVQDLFARIKADARHDHVEIREAESATDRLFNRWAMALVVEHGEADVPLLATAGGISEAAPWNVTPEQEPVLALLRDITRGYGRSY